MVAAQSKFMEDFTAKSQITPPTGFGFFENVNVLENVADVTPSRVDSIISQFRKPTFTKGILEIIQNKAKKYIDHLFKSNGYAEDDDVISLWTKEEYVDNLEKLFHNSHFDITTLNRFGKIDFKLLYVAGKLSPKLCNQVFELTANMPPKEMNDVQFQKILINRAFHNLHINEPVRIQLTAAVNACKTFEEFFMLWSRYKVKKQEVVDDLITEGYTILPKIYLMAGKDSVGNAGKPDKPPKTPKGVITDLGREPKTQFLLDPKYVSCDNCGRQEFDNKQNAIHTVDNCYLKHHEDRNTNHNVRWKDSASGKAFAALTPSWNVLPFGLRKDGSKRIMAPKGNISCINCDYLVSLKNNFLKFSSNINFLPLTMISIQLPTVGTISLKAQKVDLRGLLDSGSLAGDFISQDVIENFNLNSYIKLDTSSKKICSGLDNSCSLSLGSLTASVTFINELNNKSEILNLIFKVLQNSPIDLVIGRESIKRFDLVSKNSSHFFSKPLLLSSITEDLTCTSCSAKEGPVHTCGCQRQTDRTSDLLLNVSQTEIQVVGNTNRIARHYSDPPTVERNMLSRQTLASLVAPWGDNPPSEPRAGDVLLGDNPPQSLMAVTQTHTVYSSFTDVESYKLNDELIYNSLYNPLHEEPKVYDVTYCSQYLRNLNNEMVIDPTHISSPIDASVLSAVLPDIPNRFIDDDKIDQLSNDTFSPWTQPESSTEELLEMIHIEGDSSLQQGIRELCKEYGHIFALKLPSEASKLTPFNITVDSLAWRVPKNRMPPRKQSSLKQVEIAKQVEDLLEQGIIERSTAEYYSQVVVVPKPDGKHRLCIDFQNLNLVSESHSHPVPNIKQMLNRLGDHRSEIFGVMDLTQGYHQVGVSKSSMLFTAFIVFCGIYHFCRLPMGPKKAPAHFQEQMAATVLLGLIYYICEVYLDDIIVHGKTNEEFLFRLRQVFERMDRYLIKLKPTKCRFGTPKIEYCGRVISKDGLSMSEKKIASVINFPLPEFARQLKGFLGLANYFREFVPNHSTVVQPLQALIPEYRRSNRIVWNDEARLAYASIKQLINDCPTMYFLLPEGELYLYTDASDYGIGGYLYQIIDAKERPVAFVSKSLTSTQLRWAIIQKEAYAIFETLKQLDHLLRDRKFKLFTDHKNLLYITESSNPMIYRWWMSIQELDFTKEFTLGVNNPIADGMSRLCPNLMIEEPDLYDDTDILCAITEKFILNSSEYQIISSVHNSLVGHGGLERTVKKLTFKLQNLKTSWKFLRQKVKRFIALCPCCQKMSQLKIPIAAQPFTVSSYSPMECLNIDFVGPYPDNGYVLVMTDTFTRWVELTCVDAATAEQTALSLLSHFGRFGSPAYLTSDRGSHFVNAVIEEFLRHIGTQHILTLAYSKEENAIVERTNKEVNRHLRALTFDKNTVDDYRLCVPIVQRILNSSYNERTGISPAELLFGNAVKLDRGLFLPPSERNASVLTKPLSESTAKLLFLQDQLIAIAADRLQITDSQRLGYYSTERTEYASGDFVLVNCRKQLAPTRLHTKLQGPLRVISNNGNEYILFDLVKNKEKHYHVTDMRPFHFDPSITDPLDIARRDYLEFFIEKVLDHRGYPKRKSSLEFLIQWMGYDSSYNSWEPWSNFSETECLHDYLREKNLSSLIPKKYK
jgi:transposase InsO family protein